MELFLKKFRMKINWPLVDSMHECRRTYERAYLLEY